MLRSGYEIAFSNQSRRINCFVRNRVIPIWTIVLALRNISCPSLCMSNRIIENLTHHQNEQLSDHELEERENRHALDQRPVVGKIF